MLTRRLKYWLHSSRRQRSLQEEVAQHLEEHAADLRERGLDDWTARTIATRRFGNPAIVVEDARQVWIWHGLDSTFQDLRYAVRTLSRSRAFTVTSVVTLAVAIGAAIAMFGVLNAVLLRPLPYESPDELVILWTTVPGQDLEGRPDYLTVEELRNRTRSLADLAVIDPVTSTLSSADGAERISVARVSPNLIPLLGIQPTLGRTFSPEEAETRRSRVLISHSFWQDRFGGSPEAIGASLVVDGLVSDIVGILPPGFQIPSLSADVWEPHTLFEDWEVRRSTPGEGSWFVVGRLDSKFSIDQARQELGGLMRLISQTLPEAERNREVRVVPLAEYVVSPRSRLALWMLSAGVALVLMIAVANVVSLMLARSVERAREIALRTALGASPRRIFRHLLAEGAALAAVSGLVGTLLAVAGMRLLTAWGPGDLARLGEIGVDREVLVFAGFVSLTLALVLGLAAVVRAGFGSAHVSMQVTWRAVSHPALKFGFRRVLVAGEIALTVVLLVGAGLLVRSWLSINEVDPGFVPRRILSVNMTTNALLAPQERIPFYSDVLEEVESLPAVERAGLIGDLLISGDAQLTLTREGNAESASGLFRVRVDEVSADLFATLQTPLLRGRSFSAADGPNAPRVAIVNDTLARRLWPGTGPIDRRFKFGPKDSDGPWFIVVGVVGDMHRQGPDVEPIPQIFLPLAQQPSGNAILLVRTVADDPLTALDSVRAAVHRVRNEVPLYSVARLSDQMGRDVAERRFQTFLLIAFSLIGLLIASVGIFGLIQYSVSTRTREIGIRVAVGAETHAIIRMIVGEGLRLTLAGLAVGLCGAYWLGQAGASLLFKVSPTDPPTFLTGAVLLTVLAAAASFVPVWRATRLDVLQALREE